MKDTPHYGAGHKGVFSKNTKFWVWTDRIKGIPGNELRDYIHKTFGNDNREALQIFLRQGFVLPHADIFHTNPTDAGRYFNHSSNPNCGPDGTLRDIRKGEELTMNYCFHNDPMWYREICKEMGRRLKRRLQKIIHS